ncbi:MAG: biotin/lipoyl-binding protein, partial [Solirubrobacterales bacterium]|nr:biotin/lipoyl-binding protein [Solirubrobacterales bacterium]
MSQPCESPLSGFVVSLIATEGSPVQAGSPVIVIESMKMHHDVAAPVAGIVTSLSVVEGDQVEEGQLLFSVEPGTGAPESPDDAVHLDEAVDQLDADRDDLTEVLERRAKLLDA